MVKFILRKVLTRKQFVFFREFVLLNKALFSLRRFFAGIKGRKKLLIYVGVNHGSSLMTLLHRYDKVYAFEADPRLAAAAVQKFKRLPHVHIMHAAVTDYDGEIDFFANDNDATSSLSKLKENSMLRFNANMKYQAITVPAVNLINFCKSHNIEFIDDYISDIQGHDLQVLKTMQPFVEGKKIGTIQCEVYPDGGSSTYMDIFDNGFSSFKQLLEPNFKLVAMDCDTVLKDGLIRNNPEWTEFDCKWKRVDTNHNTKT